jgi:hypothetical protein
MLETSAGPVLTFPSLAAASTQSVLDLGVMSLESWNQSGYRAKRSDYNSNLRVLPKAHQLVIFPSVKELISDASEEQSLGALAPSVPL